MSFGTNILGEPALVSEIQNDYIKYIDTYKNLLRSSIFVRYYNINSSASSYDPKTLATLEEYMVSNIVFDIYDYTPLMFSQPLQNKSVDDAFIRGFTFDGSESVIIYTIKEPKLGDLITFYPPLSKSKDIFKVNSLGLNTYLFNNNLPYFEVELEYAPIKSVEDLKINKSYVYMMSSEKYLEREEYDNYTQQVERIQFILLELNKYFDKLSDIYQNNQKVLLVTNELIIRLKKEYNSNYNRLFEQVRSPFNYNTIVGPDTYLNYDDMPFKEKINNKFAYFNLRNNKVEYYTWYQDEKPVNEFEDMISLTKKLYDEMITFNIIEKINS